MNADPLAHWYRWIEYAAFGRALERHRFVLLDRLSKARTILVLGEGDGRSLARLVDVAPKAHIDVVESSARMVELASRRVSRNDRVRFYQQDASKVTWPRANYDAIITSFFLDCFDETGAKRIVEHLRRALAPDGIWLMNDFAIPCEGWRRWQARAWIALMYFFFRLTTGLRVKSLPPIETLLAQAGLTRSESVSSNNGMIVSQIWRPRNTKAGPA